MEISFLCTRLIDPDIDNYKKLERFINYIQGKFGLPLILSIDKSVNIKLYVNAAFVVHKYIRSHTDSFMNMGTNGVYVQFSKKKLNTKSSTEENIFGVGNVLTRVIWAQCFLKENGYWIHNNIIYKHNRSAIKLEKNGRR